MTPTSLIPQEAAVLGMDYPTLCEELTGYLRKNINKNFREIFYPEGKEQIL